MRVIKDSWLLLGAKVPFLQAQHNEMKPGEGTLGEKP